MIREEIFDFLKNKKRILQKRKQYKENQKDITKFHKTYEQGKDILKI